MRNCIAEHWISEDCLEICWSVPYSVSPVRPATHLDPPEGGIEVTGEPWVSAVIVYSKEDRVFSVENIAEGSFLDTLTQSRFSLSQEAQWWAVSDDAEAEADNAAAAYEAACEAGYRGPRLR